MRSTNLVEIITNNMRDDNYSDIRGKLSLLNDLEQTDRDGRTLLINAAYYNRDDVVQWLVQQGANINAQDHFGNSPLHAAVQNGNLIIIRILLDSGADTNIQNNFGNTPIWIAKPAQPTEVFKLLLQFGADPTLKNKFDVSAIDRMAAYPEIIKILKREI